jgi:hypothetical protein
MPMRDLLAPSLPLHRNNITLRQFSLPLCWEFLCPNSTAILHTWRGVQLWLRGPTHLGHLTLGQLAGAPFSPNPVG